MTRKLNFRNTFSCLTSITEFTLILFFLIITFSCEKFEPKKKTIKIETGVVTNITSIACTVVGTIMDTGEGGIIQHGHCWGTSQNPDISLITITKLGSKSGTGIFTSNISNLLPGTTYYVRAYATNNAGTVYGNEINFTTPATLPTVSTSAVSNVTSNSVQSGGNVTDDGGASVTARGVCWSTSQNPTTANSKTTDGTGTGSFTSNITGLSCEITYYVRAYATNSAGTAYGPQVSFTTSQCPVLTVTTISISNITENSAQSGGNVTNDGGTTVTARGVCWSTSQNPTTANSKTTDGTGTGSFTSNLTGLSCEITYYVRAYAINSAGTAYGPQVSFTTSQCPVNLPTVTTTSISNITENLAQGGGNVTDDGGASVTARGVCWSTSQNPTTANSKTTDGAGTGSFTSNLTGLSCEITYYVRAYATNSAGTAYGPQVSFTTSQCPVLTVTTTSISNITENSAQSGGNVTDDGGASVTARGVCWSTSQNPTITNDHTTDGSGTGSFVSSITSLSSYTTYYVRAYATNSIGTAYGSEVTFTTLTTPTLTTTTISAITENSAQSGGNITDDGGATVTVRGVCWSTSQNPTLSDSYTTDGSGIGNFTSSITGLTPTTTYYVRAYATNSVGTAYGDEIMLITIEDFESYTANSFPSSWIPDGNATNESLNFTDASVSYDGTKSLRLYGTVGSCWAAIAYHPIPVSPSYEIEFAVRNGNEDLSGCNPHRAHFSIRKGTSWANPERRFIYFRGDGTITGGDDSIDLGTYNTLTWYVVKVRYEIISQEEIRLSYWINGSYLGSWTLPAQAEENQLTNINIAAVEGTVWFDVIRVTKF